MTLTFDLLTLDSGQTWLVTCSTPPPRLKILRLPVLDLMSYDVRHRLPLTMRLEPLLVRRFTWPVANFSQIFEIPDPFLFTMQTPPRLYDEGKLSFLPKWPCVKGECDICACAKSRDLSAGGQKQLRFWNLQPRYAFLLYNFYGATMKIKGRLYTPCSKKRETPNSWP